jgi:hypothetical protein
MLYPASDGRDRVHGILGLCGRSHLSSLQPTFHQSDYHTGFAPIDTGPLPGTSSDDPRRPRTSPNRADEHCGLRPLISSRSSTPSTMVNSWAIVSHVQEPALSCGREREEVDPSPTSLKRRDERLVSSRLVSLAFIETSARLKSRVPFDSCRPTNNVSSHPFLRRWSRRV